jgi:hypothetical protein
VTPAVVVPSAFDLPKPASSEPSRPLTNGSVAFKTEGSASGLQASSTPVYPNKINSALALLADVGYPGVTAEDLGKLRPVDEFAAEIAVMSEVRGYFQCAYKVRVSFPLQPKLKVLI